MIPSKAMKYLSLLLLPLSVFFTSFNLANANGDYKLYGLGWDTSELVEIDIETGEVTVILTLPIDPASNHNYSLGFDYNPSDGHLYVSKGDPKYEVQGVTEYNFEAYQIDLSDNSVTLAKNLTLPFPFLGALGFKPNGDAMLYREKPAFSTGTLYSIDWLDNSVSPVGSSNTPSILGGDYDVSRDVFWASDEWNGKVYQLSVENGSPIWTTQDTYQYGNGSGDLLDMDVTPTGDILVAASSDTYSGIDGAFGSNEKLKIFRINPDSGSIDNWLTVINADQKYSIASVPLDTLDTDGDGLDDSVETNTGIYVSEADTGTDPNNADTDGDGVPDGLEITEGTDPTDLNDFNSFSTGLVAYYPFDNYGNLAGDSGFTAYNEASLVDGPWGKAFRIVGNSSSNASGGYGVLDLPQDLPATGISYSFWIYEEEWPGGFHGGHFLDRNLDGLGHQWMRPVGDPEYGQPGVVPNASQGGSAGQVIVPTNDGIDYQYGSTVTILRRGWRLYTVVADPNGTQYFVDGQLRLTSVNSYSQTGPVRLGYHDYGTAIATRMTARYDNLRVYDKLLSADEVLALFHSEAPQFQIIEGEYTWHEAKTDAEARGGRLAVLNTQERYEIARPVIESFSDSIWIGLTDEVIEGEWLWVTGEPLTFERWLTPSQPDNSGDEDYAIIGWISEFPTREWNDFGGWRPAQAYLLEILPPPEPLAPVLDVGTFYESNSDESITIDATPIDGYPTNYAYQWYFNNSPISPSFGGASSSLTLTGSSFDDGTWKVEVTNDTGTTSAEFNYRVYADSDNDGLSDGQEAFVLGTDPNNNDSDDDTLLDGVETNTGIWLSTSNTGTDPLSNDSDSDGLSDGVETNTAEYIDASDTGTDPNDSDTDNDGLLDGAETNTDVYVSSSDTGSDPLDNDSDSDGILDGYETATGSWLSSEDTGTNPTKADSDADGLSDGVETNSGVFVGLSDTGTDPNSQDSDGDGFTDKFEVDTSCDPTSITDTPDAYSFIETAVEVNFYGAIGGTYRIEHAEDLESDIWVTVEDGIEGSSELIERLYSTDEYSRRFFRVVRTDQ